MKKRSMIILFFLCVSYLSRNNADTCPLPSQFTQTVQPTAPAGWTALTTLTPAILPGQSLPTTTFPGQNYYFISATHSLNPSFYHLRVICLYQCPPYIVGCAPLTLVSNAQYKYPITNNNPWNAPFNLINTLVCAPKDNDPLKCEFSIL